MVNFNQSRVFDTDNLPSNLAPDSVNTVLIGEPDFSHVLCRDRHGIPTAVFGEDKWDFNPYRLSARKQQVINFQKLSVGEFPAIRRKLINEAKYLLFLILYYSNSGKVGTLAVSTIYNYYNELAKVIEYCVSMSSNPFVGAISLKEFFSSKRHIVNFLSIRKRVSSKKRINGMLNHFSFIGAKRLGFIPMQSFSFKYPVSNQTPVIPTRIYLHTIANLTNDVEYFSDKLDALPDFLSKFRNKGYGRHKNTQRNKMGIKNDFRPNFTQALENFSLNNVFQGEFYANSVCGLSSALKKIQLRMNLAIHLYTGMRDQEVMRINYDCISSQIISSEACDSSGNNLIEERGIQLISTTTKYSGYRQLTSWYAPPIVSKAVGILQKISLGLSKLYGIKLEDCPLFLNPAVLKFPDSPPTVTDFKDIHRANWMETLIITPEDFAELQSTDCNRDFTEKEYQIGENWPLRRHQFRRSLAFYASSSGFVKLPTLKRQFKHLTVNMTRYYSRNFENLKSIFGYYNPDTKAFELPGEHVINDCQTEVSLNAVEKIIEDLLLSEETLFGKTGGYIERNKRRLREGEVLIEDLRKNTLKRVDSGELHYRETLLGGCLKSSKCDDFMLGDFTKCLVCSDAAISKNKLESQISILETEVSYYKQDSGEYQVVSLELESLKQFQEVNMAKLEV